MKGLGLRRIGHTVEVEDTPAVRMINKVNYMVSVERMRGHPMRLNLCAGAGSKHAPKRVGRVSVPDWVKLVAVATRARSPVLAVA